MENQYQGSSQAFLTPVNPMDKFLGIFAVWGALPGVIMAYFGGDVNGQRSDYLKFYCNEGLVFFLSYLLALIPIIGWAWTLFTFVCQIIAVVYACQGIAKPVLFFGTIGLIK